MAITLAEAKVGMADKVDQMIVDEFRRSSLLLDRLVFDNAISPGTGGSTLTYGYIQLKTPSTAAVRAINSEYTANEAKRVEKTAKAIIMGGSFEVDRVLQNTSGAVDGSVTMLMMNGDMLLKVRAAARRAGYYERTKDDFGRVVETFAGIPLLDMGKYYNGSASVDVIGTSTPSTSAAGTTSIYAVSIGLDGFHGISPTGNSVISSYMPDMTAPGAVKKGEVELVAGIVLKNTLKAAALNGIVLKPKTAT